jgi:hypothetical protein
MHWARSDFAWPARTTDNRPYPAPRSHGTRLGAPAPAGVTTDMVADMAAEMGNEVVAPQPKEAPYSVSHLLRSTCGQFAFEETGYAPLHHPGRHAHAAATAGGWPLQPPRTALRGEHLAHSPAPFAFAALPLPRLDLALVLGLGAAALLLRGLFRGGTS